MVEFNKKIIVIAEVAHLSDSDFMTNANEKAQAQIDFPTYVPGLNPTASVVQTLVGESNTILEKRDSFLAQAKSLTTEFNQNRKKINDNIISWAGQIQDALDGDIVKIQKLKYGVKNLDPGPAPEINITNSKPVLIGIDLNLSMHHTLHFVNSKSETNFLPEDVDYIDVYETFDETLVGNLRKMSHLGKAKRGKFVNTFTLDELHKTVWYVAVYVPKKGSFTPAMSVAVSAKVV